MLFLIIILSGCSEDNTDWIRINNTFFISLDENIRVIDSEGNSLSVSIAKIDDARCPKNQVCISQGEAIVKVIIEDTRNSQFKTLLCIGNCSPSLLDIQAFTFYSKEYVLKLLEIDPYPTLDNVGHRKKALLKIYEN